jgi:tetratricopeptide (TPR) repeat protein
LWIFFHQSSAVEVGWIGIVLRSGLAYTFDVRGTPLDRALLTDFETVIANFHFLPEARQEAWDAIEAHDPAHAYDLFRRLADANAADGNAIYGLGLAELALGRARDALAHLKQADAMIGLGEAQQAIGQAYLQSGDSVRALATWYRIILDNPDQEKALEPSVANALAAAPVPTPGQPLPVDRQKVWEDFVFFGDLASIDLQDDLTDARSGDFDQIDPAKYREIDDRLELLLGATIEHLRFEGGDPAEAHYLAAAFIFRQATREAITAIQRSDLAQLEKAGLEMREGLESSWAASSGVEAEE